MTLLALLAAPSQAPCNGPREAADVMRLQGTLRTGVMAIGAETTGITVTTREGAVWELLLTRAQRAKAERLDGRRVVVEGFARERPGVEVRTRRIIEVRRLEAASR